MQYDEIAVFNPLDKHVYAFRLNVLPFSQFHAPSNWRRGAAFTQHFPLSVFATSTGCSAGDICDRGPC